MVPLFHEILQKLEHLTCNMARMCPFSNLLQITYGQEACLFESKSKPGIEIVYPEPCKELRRRPQLFMAGSDPY